MELIGNVSQETWPPSLALPLPENLLNLALHHGSKADCMNSNIPLHSPYPTF